MYRTNIKRDNEIATLLVSSPTYAIPEGWEQVTGELYEVRDATLYALKEYVGVLIGLLDTETCLHWLRVIEHNLEVATKEFCDYEQMIQELVLRN